MALLPPPDISAAYVDDQKRPSKDFYNWIKSLDASTRENIDTANIILFYLFSNFTVGTLPAAGTVGLRTVVTDATATTFTSVVVGGGANTVPVYDDGTNWRIG